MIADHHAAAAGRRLFLTRENRAPRDRASCRSCSISCFTECVQIMDLSLNNTSILRNSHNFTIRHHGSVLIRTSAIPKAFGSGWHVLSEQ